MKCNRLATVKKVVVSPHNKNRRDTFYFCEVHATQIVTKSVTEALQLIPLTEEEKKRQVLCGVYV